MKKKQIVILIVALAASVLILWYNLPIQFPWVINLLKLCLQLAAVWVLFIILFVFTGGKKKAS
jgi:hypothetical protein